MSGDRLDSWKEIAAYLRRGVRTAQRWERDAGLPVRRVAHARGAVYAFRGDLDAWWQGRLRHTWVQSPGSARAERAATPSVDQARARSSGQTRVQPFLSQDVRVDPDSAPGHAGMAVYFFTLTAMGLLGPDEGMPAARGAARRALDLDPGSLEALALDAVVTCVYDLDWAEAERRFAQAMARDDVPASVRFHYANWFLSPLQRHDEAIAQCRRALADDPLYLLGRVSVGVDLCSVGQIREGCAELEGVLRIDPKFGPALGHLGRETALRGHTVEALALAERAYESIPGHPNAAGLLAGMLARTGSNARSRTVLEALELGGAWRAPRARAESYLVQGELDEALECVAAAIACRDPGVWVLLAGSAGPRLRARPRWTTLHRTLNLPQARASG